MSEEKLTDVRCVESNHNSRKEVIQTDFRSIWTLVWPQACSLIAMLLMSLTDTWVAAKFDREVLASFGILNQSLMFLSIIDQGVMGATLALVGQARGAGLYARSKRIGVLMCMLAVGSGVGIAALAYMMRNPFVEFFNTPKEFVQDVILWFGIYMLCIPFKSLFLTTNAILRSIEHVRVIFVVSILSTVVNAIASIVLSLGTGILGEAVFNYIPFEGMGPVGIALATLVTLIFVTCINIVVLYRFNFIRMQFFPTWRWFKAICKRVLYVALPIIGTQVLWQTGYLLVFALMAKLPEHGRVGIAGFTLGMRIESMLFIPGSALQFTASILISHLIGAKEYGMARKVATKLLYIGVISMTLLVLPVWYCKDSIVALFTNDALVQHNVVLYLLYNLSAIPFIMITITGSGIFTGAGATMYTLVAFTISMWCFRLPVAYVLGYTYAMNAEGVYMSMFISALAQSMVILYFYVRKRWEYGIKM